MPKTAPFTFFRQELRGLVLTFGLVAATTLVIILIVQEFGLTRGTVVYMIPVLVAGIRWGLASSLFAAFCGVLASAYFFFPPLYSFKITDPQETLNLGLYIFAAVTVSQLSSRLKRELELSRKREIDMRDLYAFSRRLAMAFDVSDIHAAIEDHLTTVLQRKVVLFSGSRDTATSDTGRSAAVPQSVLNEILEVVAGRRNATGGVTVAGEAGEVWLVRPLSSKSPEFGVIAINFGRNSNEEFNDLRIYVDAMLADATATLERLGIAHAISEARMRAQTDQLREALIGSVSHELRTPLASILGAATVLSAAPALRSEPKLEALVHAVHGEAERLNNDIQNLLDATRISSDGIKPHLEWADPADIINAAIEHRRRHLADRHLDINVPSDLPLIHVDSVLVTQALVQIFDNAVKYSQPNSSIAVTARARDGRLIISVSDEGAGLTDAENEKIWGRFARGERHAVIASGSGLGLWIANAFVAANGGKINAISEGPGRGTTMTIELPVMLSAVSQLENEADD